MEIDFEQTEQNKKVINMKRIVEEGLHQLAPNENLLTIRPVSGGDINLAFYVQTDCHEYFVKANSEMSIGFFEFEKRGLEMIRDTHTIDVPNVIDCIEVEGIPMLWLEWIEGEKRWETDLLLGERLARMHLVKAEGYGFEGESYIGRLKQENELMDDWLEYYRNVRLMGQLKRGRASGIIRLEREKRLVTLIERLDEWIPRTPKSCLLHGDLWGGNWMCGPGGTPYLIDPAVLYGHHEFELAFTELFGGFSTRFYESYNTVFPLSKEYDERKELYQLYYLLVHLNMFGESYGGSVDRILRRYVG
jgi:fructosamine-3-kinase